PQIVEAEIFHHARGGADIAGLARLDEDDANHAFRPAVIPSREDGEESPDENEHPRHMTRPSSALRAPSPRTRGEGQCCPSPRVSGERVALSEAKGRVRGSL